MSSSTKIMFLVVKEKGGREGDPEKLITYGLMS